MHFSKLSHGQKNAKEQICYFYFLAIKEEEVIEDLKYSTTSYMTEDEITCIESKL
jgi:hypothetical protein